MKTIKKIEFLNMLSEGNGPERFIDDNVLWYKGKSDEDHYYSDGGKYQLNYIYLDELNDVIELFDEPTIVNKEKDIFEEAGEIYAKGYKSFSDGWDKAMKELNELKDDRK